MPATTWDDDEVIAVRSRGLSWREVGEEVIVLDLERSHYVNLNGPAAFLWQLIAEGATPGRLVASLLQGYDVDPDRARADVSALLSDLHELGLLGH